MVKSRAWVGPLVLVVAGCSAASNGGASPSLSAQNSESSTTAPAETPAVAYLKAVCPANAAQDRYQAVARNFDSGSASTAKLKAAAARVAVSDRKAAAALDSPTSPWPANVAKEIDTVVNANLAAVTYYEGIASAKNRTEVIAAAQEKLDDNSKAQKVRLRLGLPAANSKNDGCAPYAKG